ncbi:hypothetical protein HK102_001829 [Quaeritorhiza haematococci]|nr:hypothetical protein HK102_001829 [Quaeritorhiza haematococci]
MNFQATVSHMPLTAALSSGSQTLSTNESFLNIALLQWLAHAIIYKTKPNQVNIIAGCRTGPDMWKITVRFEVEDLLQISKVLKTIRSTISNFDWPSLSNRLAYVSNQRTSSIPKSAIPVDFQDDAELRRIMACVRDKSIKGFEFVVFPDDADVDDAVKAESKRSRRQIESPKSQRGRARYGLRS